MNPVSEPPRSRPLTLHARRRASRLLLSGALSAVACLGLNAQAWAETALPGKGITVQAIKGTVDEEAFQTLLVTRALERLGYTIAPLKSLENATQHVAVAQGDATFTATHWIPLHQGFYERNGGAKAYYREGVYSDQAAQGYLIDKKTAQAHGITQLTQLKDLALARLFDTDGDGKADLTGCNPGWGCELAINRHLEGLQLQEHITHRQGNYQALIADSISRYQAGQPILYYVWSPFWVNTVLQPGKDVVWLEVPNLPGATGEDDTRLPNGKNYGFKVNQQHILANRSWALANPAAAKLFSVMQLSVDDINAQNLRMRQGEKRLSDIDRHVDAWIQAHQAKFDGWIAQALAAARSQPATSGQ